jgi:hypothetical protein
LRWKKVCASPFVKAVVRLVLVSLQKSSSNFLLSSQLLDLHCRG